VTTPLDLVARLREEIKFWTGATDTETLVPLVYDAIEAIELLRAELVDLRRDLDRWNVLEQMLATREASLSIRGEMIRRRSELRTAIDAAMQEKP
jgi:hypothetical protein